MYISKRNGQVVLCGNLTLTSIGCSVICLVKENWLELDSVDFSPFCFCSFVHFSHFAEEIDGIIPNGCKYNNILNIQSTIKRFTTKSLVFNFYIVLWCLHRRVSL